MGVWLGWGDKVGDDSSLSGVGFDGLGVVWIIKILFSSGFGLSVGTTTPVSEEVCTGDGVGSGDSASSLASSFSIAGVSGFEGGVCTGFSACGSLSSACGSLSLSDCSGMIGLLISSSTESDTSGFEVRGSLLSSSLSLSGTSESFLLGFDVAGSLLFSYLGDSENGGSFAAGVGDSSTFISSFLSSDTGIVIEGKGSCLSFSGVTKVEGLDFFGAD